MTWTPPSTPARRLNSCVPRRLCPRSAVRTGLPTKVLRRLPPRRSRAKPAALGSPGMCLPCLDWWYSSLIYRKTASVRLKKDVYFSWRGCRSIWQQNCAVLGGGELSSRDAGGWERKAPSVVCGCCANPMAEAVWWPLGPRWHAECLPDAGSSTAFNLTVSSCTK